MKYEIQWQAQNDSFPQLGDRTLSAFDLSSLAMPNISSHGGMEVAARFQLNMILVARKSRSLSHSGRANDKEKFETLSGLCRRR